MQVRSISRALVALAVFLLATTTLAFASTITVNKTFSPSTVSLGAASTVTVTLENNSTASSATITNFIDDVASMSGYATLNASYTPTTTCSGGTPSISGTQVVMTSGTIPKGTSSTPGSCTITFQVYGAIVGNGFNTISAANVSTSLGSPSADVTQTLTVNSVNVTISNGSAQTTLIGSSNSASPTFTIHNPAANVPLTNVAFSVSSNGANFPYTVNSISNTCGATTATSFPLTVNSSSAQTFSFTGGTIPAGGTCVVTFNVSEAAVGTINFSLPATTVTDTQNVSNTSAGSTQAHFVAGPTVTKSFNPTTLVPGSNATLTIRIQNTLSTTALTNAAVTDNFPSTYLTLASTPSSTGCGSPTFGGVGTSALTMTAATISAAGTCTITATVALASGAPNGSITNTIPASNFTSDQTSSASGSASGSGTVSSSGSISTSKSFSAGSAASNTPVLVTLKFFAHGNGVTFSGGSFTDSLPQTPEVMEVYNDGGTHVPSVSGCGSATASDITATNGATSVTGSNLSIPSANGTCTVTFYAFFPNATQSTSGTTDTNKLLAADVSFTSSATSSTVNPSNSPSANLTESPSLVLKNYVSSEQNLANQPTTVQASITDAGGATDTGVTVILKTTSGKVSVVNNSVSYGTGCPAGSATYALESVTITFASISANCTISYQVVDEGGVTGTFVPASSTYSGALTGGTPVSFTGQNSVTFSHTSIVVTKSFGPNQIQAGANSTASVTLNVNQITGFSTTLVSGVSFSDALPANVSFSTSPNVAFGSGCNADGSNAQNYSISGTTITFTGLAFEYTTSSQPCVVSFSVTSSTVGAPLNVIPAGGVTSTSGATNAAKAQASLTVASGVGLGKTFENASMAIGSTNDVRLLFTNSTSTTTLTGGTVSDNMPSSLVLQSTTPGATQPGDPAACTATIAGTVGSSAVSITGLQIPALVGSTPGQCVLYVPVTTSSSATPGSVTNTIPTGALSIGGFANQNPASGSVTLTAPPAPTITKSFSASSIAPGGTSTLTITIANTASGAAALSGMALTDTLPSGVTIASTPAAATTCSGGSVTATGGGTSVALSGGSVAANGTCTITVNVTASSAGSYTNTIPASALSTTQGATNASPATATLTVAPPVTISKSFSPASITSGMDSTLTVTIDNSAAGAIALSGMALTDTLPSGVTVASTPNASTTCGGTASATAGGSSLGLSGGSVGAGSSCTITVSVTGTTPAIYTNTIPASALTTTQGITNASPASATLTITAAPNVTLSKGFSAATISPNGTSLLTVTIANTASGAVALSALSVTDTLPSGVVLAPTPNLSTTCGGGSVTAVGSTGIALSGGTVGAAASCTISADVTAASAGSYVNTIAANSVTSTQGATNGSPATATLTVAPPVTISKAFGVSSIAAGSTTTLTVTIANTGTGAIALSSVALSDSLPANLAIANAPNASTTCTSGTASATAGGTTLGVSGASLAAGASCTVSASVTSQIPGSYLNTIPASALTTAQGITNGAPASATLTVTNATGVTITKSFSPATIAPNGTSLLTISIANTGASASALTNVALTDSLPSGVAIASVPNAATTCASGSATAVAGSGSVALSGASIGANATCAVTVNVTAASAGSYTNTIPASALTSTQGATNASPASATLTVGAPVTVTKSFSPASIAAGGVSTLTVTIANTATGAAALSAVALSDALPSGVTVASTPNAATTCTSASVTANAGGSTLAMSGGSIAAGATCTMSVKVTATIPGSYLNTIPASTLTSAQGITNGAPATATLTVTNAPNVTLTKSFSPVAIAPHGTSVLTISIGNTASGATALSALALSDALPSGVTLASVPGATTTCGGTVTAIGAGTSIALTGAALAANATCTVSVNVTGTAPGSYVNTIPAGNVTSAQGASNGSPASATLTIANAAPVTVTKAFSPSTIAPGAPSVLTITIANAASGAIALSGLGVTDTLPANVVVYSTPGAATTCGGGSVTAVAGAGSIVLANGTLGAGASCTVRVSVTSNVANSYVNTIPAGAVTSTQGGTNTSPASATLVVGQPSLKVTKTSNPQNAQVSPGETISYTIDVANTGSLAETNATVTDTMTNATLVPGSVKLNGASVSDSVITQHAAFGTIAPGATDVITYDATVNANASVGASVANTAVAGGDQPCSSGTCSASSPRNTVIAPALTVHKLLDGVLQETVVPGQHVVYTMTVTNSGSVPALGAVVTDNVPAGITPIRGTVMLGNAPLNAATVSGQVVTIPLGTVAPSSTVTVSFSGTVNSSVGGPIVNIVDVSASGMSQQLVSNQVIANAVSPIISVVKTASASVVSTGDRVNYSIVMSAPAGVAFGSTSAVDTLPDYEVYARGTARVNGVAQEPVVRGHVLTWTLPSLSGRATITYSVAIAPGAPGQSVLTNIVNVTATGPAGAKPGTGSGSASVRVESMAFGNCYPITGRVYEDFNGTGRFDDPDVGVAGVTIYLDDGESVVTDANGRYDFPCVRPGMHALRLDESTLPPGVTLFDDGNQIDSEKSRRRLIHRTYDLTIIEDVNFAVKPPPKP